MCLQFLTIVNICQMVCEKWLKCCHIVNSSNRKLHGKFSLIDLAGQFLYCVLFYEYIIIFHQLQPSRQILHFANDAQRWS